MTQEDPTHRRELDRFALFLGVTALLVGGTYLVPQAAEVRPWLPGEDVPLVHLFEGEQQVQEDERGELETIDVVEATRTPAPEPESPVARLPERVGAVRTALEEPDALAPFFEALASAEAGEPGRVVRVLHWGDSTIAADGITGRVRDRMQAQFGDGGPGFLSVHVDTRWQIRPGILRSHPEGSWETFNMTFAGSDEWRYGLGGNVSTSAADEETEAVLGGEKIDGKRKPLHRFDVYYQARPGAGTVSIVPRGTGGARFSTAAERVEDRFKELKSPKGSSTLWIKTHGDGPVSLYGVAMETEGPGLTWETLGVAGSSIASMINHQGRSHIKRQVERREPDLIVYQTGGNELDYPDLMHGDGSRYFAKYLEALGKIRAGSPETPCLLVAPIDQGTRKRGKVVSQDNLDKIAGLQREAAEEAGCAFWDPRKVMGGDGGFGRWIQREPQLASRDLLHLTEEGYDLIGDCMADALLDGYDQWKLAHPDAGWVPEDVEDEASELPVFEAGWEAWIPSPSPTAE